MVDKLNIVMISRYDISEVKTLSGTLFFIKESIEKIFGKVNIIDKLRPERKSFSNFFCYTGFTFRYVFLKSLQIFCKLFFNKYFDWEKNFIMAKFYCSKIDKSLKQKNYDYVLIDKGSIEISFLKTNIPIIYMTDAAYRGMINYYPEFTNLTDFSCKQGDSIEKKAFDKSWKCIFSSKWAADTAKQFYNLPDSKIKVFYNGPNLKQELIPSKEEILNRKIPSTCSLLLMGVDWKRKGCAIAIEALQHLLDMGLDANLTVCGCSPGKNIKINDKITIIPFLDKNNPADLKKILDLYNNSAYFILPARAECLSVVAIEACAFGLPLAGTGVGGMPEIIRDNHNGFTFSLEDSGAKYAEKIAENFKDKKLYKQFSMNSYEMYKNQFSWDMWTNNIKSIFD
ncbi:MAG: hypothetical protein ACD_79C00761G0004 [uncultured bacterium]|nr:MAG: hypothetical protein ACD_79C00761G0004 [uncultured bacterium]